MNQDSPWIEWVSDDQATEGIGEIYRNWKAANPGRDQFPEILKCFSHSDQILQGVMDFCYPLQFAEGSLSRWHKELLATFVSAVNQCRY